jgi:hypothetical protein
LFCFVVVVGFGSAMCVLALSTKDHAETNSWLEIFQIKQMCEFGSQTLESQIIISDSSVITPFVKIQTNKGDYIYIFFLVHLSIEDLAIWGWVIV